MSTYRNLGDGMVRLFYLIPILGVWLIIAPVGSFFLGRYVFPEVPPPPVIDCNLEESRAIEGCELAASQMEQGLRNCDRGYEQYKEAYQDCNVEVTLWEERATNCRLLLEKFVGHSQ